MLAITSLLACLYGLRAISAQSQPFTVTSFSESTFPVFPTGIATGNSQIESTFPLACASGCYPVSQYYYGCFINSTQLDGTVIPAEYCNNFFCSQGNYTQLLDCVNCIVANGDERPTGYHTNTALTAAPTAPPANGLPFNPLGLVDAEQANGWLMNVTERCSSVDRAVTGDSSVTATPTTTGPYYASFQSGDTQTLPTWTGLTKYPPAVQTLRIPADQIASEGIQSSSNSNSGSNSGTGSPTSSTAASSSSSPSNAASRTGGSAALSILGLVLTYLVGI